MLANLQQHSDCSTLVNFYIAIHTKTNIYIYIYSSLLKQELQHTHFITHDHYINRPRLLWRLNFIFNYINFGFVLQTTNFSIEATREGSKLVDVRLSG